MTITLRQMGIEGIEGRAREAEAGAISINSNPTPPAVEFYLKHGCRIIGLVDNREIKEIETQRHREEQHRFFSTLRRSSV